MGFSIAFLDFGNLFDSIADALNEFENNQVEPLATDADNPKFDEPGQNLSIPIGTSLLSAASITDVNDDQKNLAETLAPLTGEIAGNLSDAVLTPAVSSSATLEPVSPVISRVPKTRPESSERLFSPIKWYLAYDFDCDFTLDARRIVDNTGNKELQKEELQEERKKSQQTREEQNRKIKVDNLRLYLKEEELSELYKRNRNQS